MKINAQLSYLEKSEAVAHHLICEIACVKVMPVDHCHVCG
jgi:hypothetical protein